MSELILLVIILVTITVYAYGQKTPRGAYAKAVDGRLSALDRHEIAIRSHDHF